MIEIKKIEIQLKNFSLRAEGINLMEREKILLFSNNNSGKSIFLLGLTGLVRTNVRDIFYDNIHCEKNQWQNYSGVYHDHSSLIPFLTPGEFFKLTGDIKGLPRDTVVSDSKRYCDYLNFPKEAKKLINELSLGTQKKVGLIASLLGKPKIVLWDEPFTNLDDESVFSLAHLINEELKNTLVLLTSPTKELPFTNFTTQLCIKNGIVSRVQPSDLLL